MSMITSLKEKIRASNLPPSVQWRMTECRKIDSSHAILGVVLEKVGFIAHARNQLDAWRIKRFAEQMGIWNSVLVNPVHYTVDEKSILQKAR